MVSALDPLQSPTGPSAADIFSSPQPGSAKRRLFAPVSGSSTGTNNSGSESVLVKQLNSGVTDSVALGTRSAVQQQQQQQTNNTQAIMALANDGKGQVIH